ncbi:hypothetical protein [Jannaschia marina]|uniref:hypothetical protein n=1 Tax=Jannaschia marina TaxID=2741674 RepID=UPI0015CBA24B|nr:hypothetical protein [Jannaschia marina]
MHRKFIVPALVLVAGLSACNTGSDLERAAVGGVVGCAVGEIIDDGKCVTGAAVGAAGGALANDF